MKGLEKIDYSTDKVAEILGQAAWTSELGADQIKALAGHIQAYKAPKWTVLFGEGETDGTMGILIKGMIEIVKTDHEHHNKVIASLRPPQTFGEMSMIDEQPRSAKAVAATEVIILVITKDDFFEIAKTSSELALKLLWCISRMISQRLRNTSGQLAEFIES